MIDSGDDGDGDDDDDDDDMDVDDDHVWIAWRWVVLVEKAMEFVDFLPG